MHPRGTWDDELLDAEAVAQRLGVDPVTVHRWCRQGALPCLPLGPSWRIRRAALDAFRGRAEPPRSLAAHLQAFLAIPDQVLAVAEDAVRLARLEAAFFEVAAANDGLLLKVYDPHAASPRALRQELAHQGLDPERWEAAGRFRWSPAADPAGDPEVGVVTLRQALAEATAGERTVWAAINWPAAGALATALGQQTALAPLVATHSLVVLTGVVAPAVSPWPIMKDQWLRVGGLRGVVHYGGAGLVLSRLVSPPDG
jgi:excisionase family DNA binding protein